MALADETAVVDLSFGVESAAPVDYAAVPTLALRLRVENAGAAEVRSVLLDAQIQIAARRRSYGSGEQERLHDLFGTSDRWRDTLRTLPWTRLTVLVPPFSGSTVVELKVVCSYDLEVAAAGYFAALDGGEIPLELLFSGTVFYSGDDGRLQAERIAWTKEAEFALPVSVWRETMDRHFPDSAWLRLSRRSYDRLRAYRSRHAFASWDQAVDALLGSG
ncbi:MAG TPA: DUF6084 family protein [Thermoleophilaceae bacterium]